jgi:hypothetical protein
MVIRGEHRALVIAPGEQPGGERNARNDPDPGLLRRAVSTSSSGLRRKQLRMIWTVATCGRAMAAIAWAQVSTDTP